MVRSSRFVFVLALLGSWVAAARAQSTPPPEDPALWHAYYAAVRDSAIYDPANLRLLKPLVPDANGVVTVVKLGSQRYPVGPMQAQGDIWVTIVPEVQQRCVHFGADAAMRLNMLLGLPPYPQWPYAYFNVMRVRASRIFRPAADSDTSTPMPCPPPPSGGTTFPPNCGNFFPPGTTQSHITWIANNTLWAYQVSATPPSSATATVGYPWTHLGYTYDWYSGPGADRYGASEYIIPSGTYVDIIATYDIATYCKPQP